MIPLFIEYLTAAKKLPLQGVGEISVKRIAAQLDISERQVIPPASTLQFISNSAIDGANEFVAWAAKKLGAEPPQTELEYNQFIKTWLFSLQQQKSASWKGLGTWQVNEDQSISFTPEMSPAFEGLPVRAEKLIRENSTHQIRVGEDHRSSVEMTELLTQKTKKVSIDMWVGASALVLLLVFWCVYLFQHPITPDTFANPLKVVEPVFVIK